MERLQIRRIGGAIHTLKSALEVQHVRCQLFSLAHPERPCDGGQRSDECASNYTNDICLSNGDAIASMQALLCDIARHHLAGCLLSKNGPDGCGEGCRLAQHIEKGWMCTKEASPAAPTATLVPSKRSAAPCCNTLAGKTAVQRARRCPCRPWSAVPVRS